MVRESKRARQARMHDEYAILREVFPAPECALHFSNPLQLLIATVLSAQTTDRRVNTVTPELFARFPEAADLAAANPQEVEDIIHPLGFYRSKTKHLLGLAVALDERFGGEVPRTMKELTSLPGVGRKTANVVLGNAFGIPGFPVDTHVMRVTGRLRWRSDWRDAHPDPVAVEREITACFPPGEWTDLSHRLILFGRATCHARRPDCVECPLAATCPAAGAA
ncbi:endonuclease III [Bifidobacterium platyrrhinorum]|uniref:Endonuclease III n=1 Tax=Bifidobacterium platyrrhinorum TaxID=2661628 RepID=A0A6L9STC9_9BIFI|nr:endonuclease III [Bifidobacterium platyrrhinorum]NEG55295.1 endonuclease III [Bifidobacterium platyrrhinorum]